MEEDMSKNRVGFELDELLHPAQAFKHPSEVVNDADLTLNEKRAILAAWASDACAIDSMPELRQGPNGHIRFDDIMEALRDLERKAKEATAGSYRGLQHWRRKVSSFQRRRGSGDQGQPL